ncbi:hypothetical protein HNR05_002589 [Leifsonia psychrotolerans]|uniref:Uncharacterized protein n=1 Tax=Glaciibacter psychrotolerans TaxID=670054 RepID=A0A7Z0J7C5_9MICO|nr:hypothetical protein [Leifsonia psychrotolerans]
MTQPEHSDSDAVQFNASPFAMLVVLAARSGLLVAIYG